MVTGQSDGRTVRRVVVEFPADGIEDRRWSGFQNGRLSGYAMLLAITRSLKARGSSLALDVRELK